MKSSHGRTFTGYGLIFLIILLVCCGCGRRPLPSPEYPLSLEQLKTELSDTGLDWSVSRESSMQENHLVYTLNDSNDKMISMISAAQGEKEGRWLQIGFFSSSTEISTPLPQEKREQALTLAQRLYGGFDTETQLNDMLAQTGEDEFTTHEIKNAPSGPDCKKIQWKKQINGISCIISFLQFPDEDDQFLLETIVLYNSDEFIP